NSLSKRLIQGECVPISSAIRLCGSSPKTSRNPFAFVRTRCSRCIWPDSSSTQYQLLRSPRSNPTVNFCCEIFLPGFAATVLTFFIAGLLFICALSTSVTWERTPHPVRRPAFSSHLVSTVWSFAVQLLRAFLVASYLRIRGCRPASLRLYPSRSSIRRDSGITERLITSPCRSTSRAVALSFELKYFSYSPGLTLYGCGHKFVRFFGKPFAL